MKKIKFEWTTSGTVYVDVADEDVPDLLDEDSSSFPPCDLADLPKHIQAQVETEILNSCLDNPVEINGIEESKKEKQKKT